VREAPGGDDEDRGAHDGDAVRASLAEPERFSALFERHFDAIYDFVARRLGRTAADDVAGTVFVEAFAVRHRFETDRADARPWLYGIATNLVRRHRRTEERRLRAYARAGGSSRVITDDHDDRLVAGAEAPRLATALAALRAGDRDALLLYVWADLTYDEVADALAVPIGTVRSRIHRARRTMREHLDAGGPSPARIDASEGGDA
jgi:RNA polymerase sigma factor (sigma-70 family)